MSRIILIALALLSLFCLSYAHGNNGWRHKRAVESSTCSYLQCAAINGTCGSLIFCQAGQHCSNSLCVDNIPLNSTCSTTAQENECAQGTCVDTGNGPICQIYQQIMPGNPCTSDSECYFSETADGSGSVASSCILDANTQTMSCFGMLVGQTCVANHQCVVGSFCSSATGVCTPYATEGQFCNDGECSSRFTCLDHQCSARYTQHEGELCDNTDHCQPGLYCSASGSCTRVSTTPSTFAPCDISAPSCGADEQCSCKGYMVQNQVATCSNVKGTYNDMPAIEQAAYSCLDKFNCGSDTNNASTIVCISNNCAKEYCTFFTRYVNELFSEYPSCLVASMVESFDYYTLLVNTCSEYKPVDRDAAHNASSFLSASIAWITLVAISTFFFAF